MDAINKMKRKNFTFGTEGRFSVRIEYADDISHDEALMINCWLGTVGGFIALHVEATDKKVA